MLIKFIALDEICVLKSQIFELASETETAVFKGIEKADLKILHQIAQIALF